MVGDIKIVERVAPVAISASRVARFSAEEVARSKSSEALTAEPKLSSLAVQLSESAECARTRDSTLSRQQLGDLAREIHHKLLDSRTPTVQALRAREVPDSDDPQRLERALEATRFVANNYQTDSRVTNPFAGISRDELTLIVYDDRGAYTLNERDAALNISLKVESAWREKAVKAGWIEGNETGGTPNFTTECLEHYRALPAIEQALYPADYEVNLLRFIQEDLEKQGKLDEPPPMLSLVEFLARINRKLPVPVAGGENPSPVARIDNAEEIKA